MSRLLISMVCLWGVTSNTLADNSTFTVKGTYGDDIYIYDEDGLETGQLNEAQLKELEAQLPIRINASNYDPDTGFLVISLNSEMVRLHDAEVDIVHLRPVDCGPVATVDRNLDGMGANSACNSD